MTCTTCGLAKAFDSFAKSYVRPASRVGTCRDCRNAQEVRRRCLGYGLTVDEVEELKKSQGYVCIICGLGGRLCVDHCHTTNRVRGMLCARCNTGIGSFKDNPELLLNAIRYIKSTKAGTTT